MAVLSQDEFYERRHFAYTEYCRYKDDFIDFLKYVPLVKEHFKVFSPKLSSLITDICEQIVDCLEVWIRAPREQIKSLGGTLVLKDLEFFEAEQKKFITEMDQRKEKHQIMSYKELNGFIKKNGAFFGALANLEGNNVFVIDLQDFIQPFKTIEAGIPIWWDVYNSLKHDKYAARERGNLEVSLHSLAAIYRLATYAHRPDSHPLLFAVSRTSKFMAEG